MLQAVLLAAGRSTRTYPLTATRPKPLIPLLGRPLIEHLLLQLEDTVDDFREVGVQSGLPVA